MRNTIIDQDVKVIIGKIKSDIKKLSGKTILISGGAGFIGSYILRTISYLNKSKLKIPCKIISLDNYITGSKKENDGQYPRREFTFLEHDIRQAIDVNEKIDYVIHAAGLASPVYYQKYPLETIEAAIWGAKNLLELAKEKKVESFLYFSSSESYGDPDSKFIPTPETYTGNVSTIGHRACYDESKRLGETYCMTYFRLYNIPVKIIRPFNIYGPGMKPSDYRVIPTFVYRGLKGKYLPVHDKGNQTRTFCYISDACTALFKVLLSSDNGEVYNIGNDDTEINMMTLAQTVSGLMKKRPQIKMIAYPNRYPADEPKRRCPDLTKIKSKFGYEPTVDLTTGLKRTIKWFKYEYQL